MDTSTVYIRMCEKAGEIQSFHSIPVYNRQTQQYENGGMWDDGDVFWADGEDYIYGGDCYTLTIYDGKIDLGSAGSCDGTGGNVRQVVWLPRQDQLQEMVLDNHLPDELCKITNYFNDFVLIITPQFNSFEQLWLAFVMEEKYQKQWNPTRCLWEEVSDD